MTKQERIDWNMMIAQFMQVEQKNNYWYIDPDHGLTSFMSVDLRYHDQWNWLMPVVRKIVELCCDLDNQELFFSDQYTSIIDTVSMAVIEDSYKVVIEFIVWYNAYKIIKS